MPDASVCFYVSGHGFGHASRQIEIINALGRSGNPPRIIVRSSAARWLFDRTVTAAYTFLPGDVDTGVVQIDSLRLDERETVRRALAFHESLVERAQQEAALLRVHGARLVVADAPPLGCAAAAAAGIPSAVCANFTWDWIYEAYAPEGLGVGRPGGHWNERQEGGAAEVADLVARIREAYRKAQAAWRMPMHGGFEPFTSIVDIPFVARHARHARDAVRTFLDLPLDRPLALSSFGGYGVRDFDSSALDCLDDVGVVITGREEARDGLPPGAYFVDERRLYDGGPRYEDLVAAVDVVVTKPGYGIVSECIANGTAILYTPRGRFAEYDVFVREMPRYLRCRYIPQEDLLSGRWREPLRALLAQPPPPERARTDGAEVVAEMICESISRA